MLREGEQVAQDHRTKSQDSNSGNVDPQTMYISTSFFVGTVREREQKAEKRRGVGGGIELRVRF